MATQREQIKVLLLENIHPFALDAFKSEGFDVESLPEALNSNQLKEKIQNIHILGIRSKTQVTAEIIAHAKHLFSVGCFCIGTNQVDLQHAKMKGIPIFNAPFGNTRSVAEMILAEIISLARQLNQRNREMHTQVWKKTSSGCYEVRGKTLGIIGYGHIGSQLSTLAEALGMKVVYYDIVSKLPLGNARVCNSVKELLGISDFVTLHVPATPQTLNMMGAPEFLLMKKGAFLLNASRGTVVDLSALAMSIKTGHLGGAAIDVFPEEPEGNSKEYLSELQNLNNVILTPHIGGATEEAQANIGTEVPASLIRFVHTGSTVGAFNFPNIDLAPTRDSHRILNVHKNVPGVLREINRIVAQLGANIQAQTLSTDADIGYLMLDTDQAISLDVKAAIDALKTSIMTRVLY